MVAGLLIGATLVGIVRKVHNAKNQQRVARAIKLSGGFIDDEVESKGRLTPGVSASCPQWVVKLIGVDPFYNVVSVTITRERSDADLAQLEAFPRLEQVILEGIPSNSREWEELGNLRSLQRLILSTNMDDTSLVHLSGLTRLTELRLEGAGLNGSGLAHLVGLSRLRELHLDHNPVTDRALSALSKLKNLEVLELAGSRVTDAGLAQLAGLSHLHRLVLNDTDVGDAGMEYVGRLTELRELLLCGTKISNDGLPLLERLKRLETLGLSDTRIKGANLASLRTLNSLEHLDLSATEVTDDALEHIAGLAQLKDLRLGDTMVIGVGLINLKGLRSLRLIGFDNPQNADVKRFLELRSDVQIDSKVPPLHYYY